MKSDTCNESDASVSVDGMRRNLDDRIRRFPERLKATIGSRSVMGFARECGLSEGVIRSYIRGATFPTLDRLEALAAAGNVAIGWLATGEGPMREGRADAVKERQDGYLVESFALVDCLDGAASAGAGKKEADAEKVSQRIAFNRAWLHNKGLVPGKLKAITAKGDSMHPTIPDGALILVDISPIDAHDPGLDGIYVLRVHHGLVVKRLQSQLGGGIIVISDNPIYEHQTISSAQADTIDIAGRVVWIGHEV